MSYFNHAFKKSFLVASCDTAGSLRGEELAAQVLGMIDPLDNNTDAVGSLVVGKPYYFAMGPYVSSDTVGTSNTPHGGYKETIKSKIVNPKYITSIGFQKSVEYKQNIVKLVAEYNCFPCGNIGLIRVDLKGSPALRFMAHNMYKTFSADGMCCSTGESYQDPSWVLAKIGDQINSDDYWKQFITAGVDYSTNAGGAWTSLTPAATDTPLSSAYATVTGTTSGALATVTDQNQGRLVITGAYVGTTFGDCSFDPRDFGHENMLPIQIANVDVLDEHGDVCISCGTSTETQAAQMGIGHGEQVLRKIILNESYRQHHFNNGAKNSIRMREIEQGDELVSKVTRTSGKYNSYYLTHHIPRFNNPTGTFDNDQYVLEFMGEADGYDAHSGTACTALNLLVGTQIPAWATIYQGAGAVLAYQDLSDWKSGTN